jgi:hypothetical protein
MTDEPRLVSRFEANLLRILHFLLRRDQSPQTLDLIHGNMEAPPCLSRNCVELVQDALVKGCVSILARAGGWRVERFLRDGQIAEGRLWERHAPPDLALTFSENTLRFLIWITANNPAAKNPHWPVLDLKQITVGDAFLFYLAFGALRETESGNLLRGKDLFVNNGLCRLAYPDHLTRVAQNRRMDFALWTSGTGAGVLEALQPELTRRWQEIERTKGRVSHWTWMQALGRSQERVLVSFLEAVDRAARRDLARFLLVALHALLPDNPQLEWWTGGLRSAGPRLMDRSVTNRAALVLPRVMSRLQEWEQQARAVGYFDENYAASQLWKSDWEHWHGDALAGRAAALLHQIEPLRH